MIKSYKVFSNHQFPIFPRSAIKN